MIGASGDTRFVAGILARFETNGSDKEIST